MAVLKRFNIWASTWQNQQNGMCTQRRLRTAGHPPSLTRVSLCAHWVAKDKSFLHGDSEDWSDWADARLIWVFTGCICNFVGFVAVKGILGNQKGNHNREMAVAEKWPFMEVPLYFIPPNVGYTPPNPCWETDCVTITLIMSVKDRSQKSRLRLYNDCGFLLLFSLNSSGPRIKPYSAWKHTV